MKSEFFLNEETGCLYSSNEDKTRDLADAYAETDQLSHVNILESSFLVFMKTFKI